ncbi:hypothetical protein DTO166G4_6717 [Paecilomyces variotii]|nr:hypothetical protein DTO166G4_6717 [Paecilomyces variotii]KAJ9221439.1 hypothetical protein DTO169C6_6266 [Paecilomyces variotii]KAJ9379395.1 hypothetical protein DTO063F5_7165 [Paecilomyces variotii]
MQSSAFSLVSFSSFIVLLLGISLYTQEQGLSQIFSTLSHRAGLCRPDSESLHTFLPHTASWNTWFHPQRAGPDPPRERRKGWNILYHLGGYGPWIEKVDGTASTIGQGDAVAPPVGCVVDQIHVMSRHTERYPTKSVGDRHLDLLSRIKSASVALNGSLAFVNNWTYFTDEPSKDFDQLTTTGPYAGTLQAFTAGVRFRTRYANLLPKRKIRLWASDSQRVIDTARYFASGLFGSMWEKDGTAELQIIPETFERRADTLTPGDTCLKYLEDKELGHDNGANMQSLFRDSYAPEIADRLQSEGNEALGRLTNLDIFSMQEMCGFETIVRGFSPWCDVFTEDEWDHFEYARDLIHYYRAGPGNPYAGAMGWLWLNATADLLQDGPDAGTMFLSFVHDGDIAPLLVALDILSDQAYDPHLPTSHIAADRVWRTAAVLPMGGRVTFERLVCGSSAETSPSNNVFVRVNINDGIVPLSECSSGPGSSCPLTEFLHFVRRRKEEVGDFAEVCGLDGDVGRITFLRQEPQEI